MIKKLFAASAAIGAAVVLIPPAASAQPAPPVGPHQHYVVTGTGDQVRVGPNACDDGVSTAFFNFHGHVHRGAPGGNGIVISAPC